MDGGIRTSVATGGGESVLALFGLARAVVASEQPLFGLGISELASVQLLARLSAAVASFVHPLRGVGVAVLESVVLSLRRERKLAVARCAAALLEVVSVARDAGTYAPPVVGRECEVDAILVV